MFIRFVARIRHEESHRRTGVFQAADRLSRRGVLSAEEENRYEAVRQWFQRHLPVPRRLSRSGRRHACRKAICWFKKDANRYIDRVKSLVALLERHGIAMEMIRTERPGYVVYEDSYQIAAVPFRETKA